MGLSWKLYFLFFNASWLKTNGQRTERIDILKKEILKTDLPIDNFFSYIVCDSETETYILQNIDSEFTFPSNQEMST